jgi:hypothetical protein
LVVVIPVPEAGLIPEEQLEHDLNKYGRAITII